jgi:Zn-dependent protease
MPINVVLIIETFIAFIVALSFHECGHAAMAALLGDGIAAGEGRLSLNPRRHLAPIGTMVAAVLSFSHAGIGWGRPVRFDSTRLRVGPNTGTILVAVAGPLVSLILGLGLAAGLRYVPGYGALNVAADPTTGRCSWFNAQLDTHFQGQGMEQCLAAVQAPYLLRIEQFAMILAVTSIAVALVNVLPLHPLDGYKVLFALLPSPQAVRFRRWEPHMEAILLVLFFVVPIILQWIQIDFNPGTIFWGFADAIAISVGGQAMNLALVL